MIDIHIGLDLSFNSTGLTIYNELYDKENEEKIQSNIEFHRLVRDKENTAIIINVNHHIYYSQLLSVDLDLKHDSSDEYKNGNDYSNDQIDLTEKYFISVKSIMKILITYLNKIKQRHQLEPKDINIYVNMEGSILSGFNFNTQIGVNMLQGFLRAELIKLQLVNNFNIFKFRIITPTLLKMFFTQDGGAEKKDMVKSFIENYNGKKLIPQIDTSNKMVDKLNDVIDSFATVAFNLYDLNIIEKDLFNSISSNSRLGKPKTKKKRKPKDKKLSDLIDTEIISQFETENLQSQILINNGI